MPRSYLFVPASRAERFDKALAAGAGAVIIDLEDAVAPADKAQARAAVAAWLRPEHKVLVRVNAADTPWFADDVALCAHPGVSAALVPKVEDADALADALRSGARRLLPLIESAAGFAALDAIAAAPGVERLVFGSIDLQLDLGMVDACEDELLWFRTQLVLASRRAGLAAPVDGVTTTLDDAARLAEDTLRARRLGFAGKLCIHPRQVETVNRLFAPSAEERAWAQRVVQASAGGEAVAVDGRMVDKPVLMRARAILAEEDAGGRR